MNTNEINKNGNRTIKFVLISILIIAVISLIGFAYARYITMLNGNAQAPIAKWSFDYKILNSTQTREVSDFSITRTDGNQDVDSSTIAPGTSGQFIVEIDATGTETLLTYETKMTLTNKPKNLKFYWDSNKTQEIIVENETYLALNGFMSLSDNKKRDIPIYWDWPLETGSSPSEIEENDEIDTTFIGKTMSMQIATTGAQVMSNPYVNGVASTTINGKITVYNSVQDAIDEAGTNAGAVVTLLASEINENVEVYEEQNIVLNTNGKKLTSDDITILNNGTLNIAGNGTVESTMEFVSGISSVITNNKNLTIENVIIESSTVVGIRNNSFGKILVFNGIINTENTGISSSSSLNSENNPAVIINNITINAKGNCISNKNGLCIIKNGIFNMIGTNDNPAILNGYLNVPGILKVYNARVIANNSRAIAHYGSESTEIFNGYFEGARAMDVYNGDCTITGGTFKSNSSYINVNGGSLSLGTNEPTPKVDITNPIIIGENYGVVRNSGMFYFYDGIIKVKTGGRLISGGYTSLPTDYHITNNTETIDGQEYITAYLSKD